jgi:dihydrofolate synthase/folylpolyglutamate synthase
VGAGEGARPADLAGWLAYLEGLHPKSIAMGLDRVRAVHARLGLELACPVVTVGGTNGKGSTCAMSDAILRAAGYSVGVYTSPHLLRYNERVVIDGRAASDAELVEAFHAIEDARTATSPPVALTYFEFGTLAALWLFARAKPDAVILEVGLGGRLDAVNVVDADVAVLTSIDLDHQDYLGDTREAIGREKAGIFRAGRPAVCGDPEPPRSVIDHANAVGAPLLRIGVDYGATPEGTQWRYHGPGGARVGLPYPALRGAYQLGNAATVLAALGTLKDRLPVSSGAIRDGLVNVTLAGRFMVLPGRPVIVLDVAHNPHAARAVRRARRHELSSDDARRVRDVRGQGHRRRDRRDETAHRPVARRVAARAARSGGGAVAGEARGGERRRRRHPRARRRERGVPRRGGAREGD